MIRIRAATPGDCAAILAIYEPYVRSSPVTFETEPPSLAEMEERMTAGGGLYPWFVAVDPADTVVAYAYASRFRPRTAYRFAVETSVYVEEEWHGTGIGRRLYHALLPLLEAQGFTQAIAAITLPHAASVKLHEAVGFRPTGVYSRVGYKLGKWHDVGLWQRPLAPLSDRPEEPRTPSEIGAAAG
jgi:phosphinothricin acetyltransferase